MFRSSRPNRKPKRQKKEDDNKMEYWSEESDEDDTENESKTEEDNLETDSESGDELDGDKDRVFNDDDGNENESESEDEEDEKKLSKMKKVPKLIEHIVTKDWTGNIDEDIEMLKDDFLRFIQAIPIRKTKLFKEFKEEFDWSVERKREELEEDGVSKSDEDIVQEAYDKKFEEYEERFQDIIREIYQYHDIEEKSDSDDSEEEKEEEEENDPKDPKEGELGRKTGREWLARIPKAQKQEELDDL